MKKLLVVLLSLGLIVAFSTAASAVDMKFGGSYYAAGFYEDNPALATDGYSHAAVYQRGRLNPVFVIAEGLTFSNRLDFLEKQWGTTLWKRTSDNANPDDQTASRRQYTFGSGTALNGNNPKIQENVEWERAWVTFMTRFGRFDVGYQNVDDWGTDYGDFSNTRPKIGFATQLGPVTLGFSYEKVYENDALSGVNTSANLTDADKDTYAVYGVYNARGVEAGLLYKYYAFNQSRPSGIDTNMHLLSPYVKAAFGPFYVEGEAQYWFGKLAQLESPVPAGMVEDVDLSAFGLYLKGQMNLGPAYFGALFAYTSGNDMSDPSKSTANPGGAGNNFSTVAMLLMNQWYDIWNQGNSLAANTPGGITSAKYNNIIYSGFAGINPTPKLNLEANLIYATVAEKALSRNAVTGVVTNANSDKLGWELDLKATYKIYDNLTYMVGAAYLWTGDYFQNFTKTGAYTATPREVDNDYMLMNQLTLSF